MHAVGRDRDAVLAVLALARDTDDERHGQDRRRSRSASCTWFGDHVEAVDADEVLEVARVQRVVAEAVERDDDREAGERRRPTAAPR